MGYLDLLLLHLQHVGVDGERPQHGHHQLLLREPLPQLGLRRVEGLQVLAGALQVLLPLLRAGSDLIPGGV